MQSTDTDLALRNALVEQVVQLIAAGRYDELLRLAPRSRVTALEIEAAVTQYGRRLLEMPQAAHELIDYVAVHNANPAQWSVLVPMFTREEGRSDLSLELSMVAAQSGGYEVRIDDIHVL